MEFFNKAKAVRLRSFHGKYLVADEDEETVHQSKNGSSRRAHWAVEYVAENSHLVRLRSCHGKYLTATEEPYLFSISGKKVVQSIPQSKNDKSIEWEPRKDGTYVKLRAKGGMFLRGNGSMPPWRNSVTHDIPHRAATQDWVLWGVDMVDLVVDHHAAESARGHLSTHSSCVSSSSEDYSVEEHLDPGSRSATGMGMDMVVSRKPSHTSKGSDLFSGSAKAEGRMIYYKVANEDGNTEDEDEELSFTFMGGRLEELVQKLEEETGHEDIMVCSQWNKKLYPLRLQLPPNNAAMHVVVVPSSSKAARDIEVPGSLSSG